jgi:RND family efflux transporter MFP subunit
MPSDIVAELDLGDRLEADLKLIAQHKFALEQAKNRQEVFEKYTKPKTVRALNAEIEKAKSDEQAKQQTWELQKSREARLLSQIEKCNLRAPGDGLVVYANDPNRFGGGTQPKIEEGATVRERQKIFSLPEVDGPWLVNTKVRETMVARITPGQRVRVQVHAFPDEALPGVVEDVAPLPDPSPFFQFALTVYTTKVKIERSLPGLRPGMSAQVEMLLTDLDDVLSIPLQAALEVKGKDYVYLVTPDGPAKREVKLGLFNDTMIEIKEGLREGDQVALNPISLMSDAELREAFAVSKQVKVGDSSPAAVKAGKAAPIADARTAALLSQKLQNLTPEERRKLLQPTDDEEREAILKKAGFTDAELPVIEQIRKRAAPGSGLGRPRRGGGPPP